LIAPANFKRGNAMKRLLIPLLAASAVGSALLAASSSADAQWASRDHRRWGRVYAGWSHAGWGLGGVAAAPLVGGSLIPVTPYGPYPYGPFFYGLYPYPDAPDR
jgi:hypothetical protein